MNRPTLEDAIFLAANKHKHQKDKGGYPYILHLMRVLGKMPQNQYNLQCIAVLHDIVEDTSVTLDDLASYGFNIEILSAIDAISKRAAETYNDYINRVCKNELAAIVKLADLEDNLNLLRLETIDKRELKELMPYWVRALESWKKVKSYVELYTGGSTFMQVTPR